jgi:argonaute-like protein implicated in RNA metabolism and viral defense
MARLLKDIPQEFKDLKTTGDFKDRMDAEAKALKAIEARTTIVKQQMADSHAYYEVVKRQPLQLRWIPYCDQWTADPAWIRGLRLSDVEEQERWSALFTKAVERSIA